MAKKCEDRCRATAFISVDGNDNRIFLSKQHNHPVRPFDLDVPLLRQELTTKALNKTVKSWKPFSS